MVSGRLLTVAAREVQTGLRIDRFFWGTGTVLVGTLDCAVDEDVFKVGVLVQHLEKTLPSAATTPAVEALVNGVPPTKLLR